MSSSQALLSSSAPELIEKLGLEEHFEGGFFKQTEAIQDEDDLKATQIYYLLSSKSPRGKMHMNMNHTFHVHHSGRSLYTLIKPPSSASERPLVKRVVMGSNLAAGELLQLYVPGGWWKASEIPAEDLQDVEEEQKDRVGCLISEVVCPGWTINQHKFLTRAKLQDMWKGESGWEEFQAYIRVESEEETK
ncbi:hypothetical protein NliqN6_3846 [Naganishia liquefaciens]|uniref:DUF985 domain-containing protein n=1 Tax=Naganishia liquefaciens TaxID=104408 RepID=A0A8H3YFB6_9TREE|nr:hypothetical protein NliqN6_3846 [Naganishia liquefaciens]